ncbi:MAG: manganese efflux pump MntP family protein [Stellaceae bacterium]
MSVVAIVVLALSLSADAFAAALTKGTLLDRPRLGEALRSGAIFGSVEAITPVIGWAAGLAASAFIAAIDHWIAFGLLGAIGGKMIWEAMRRSEDKPKMTRNSFWPLLVTAVGTSMDAMVIGVTLAFLNADIVVVALAIGCASFVMTTIGVMIGQVVGAKLGRFAEALGGVGLIAIGTLILIEHTLLASATGKDHLGLFL